MTGLLGSQADGQAPISVLLITYNEAPNIARVLKKLQWAAEIVVVDSGSDDGTLSILERDPLVRVMHRSFDSFAGQCNFGLYQVRSDWVLSLDADYVLSDELISELRRFTDRADRAGYQVRFVYGIGGKPIRSGLYPPRTVLYRKNRAKYVDDGHGHRVQIDGSRGKLKGTILHDDRKPLARWFRNQISYAEREAQKLLTTETSSLSIQDKLRRTGWIVPLIILPYCLIVRRGLLDGWAGWAYALQRLTAEVMLALFLWERRWQRASEAETRCTETGKI